MPHTIGLIEPKMTCLANIIHFMYGMVPVKFTESQFLVTFTHKKGYYILKVKHEKLFNGYCDVLKCIIIGYAVHVMD